MTDYEAIRRLALARRYLEHGDRSAATDALYVLVAALREEPVPDMDLQKRVAMIMDPSVCGEWRI